MTMFTAPPDQTGLILNAFDILNVFGGGTATGTIINENAVENVNPGGKAFFTIMNGGTLNVGGTSIGATINGNFENVFGSGTVTDSTINAGGNEFLNAGTTAIDTIINAGGVQSGPGTAIGTLINEGGSQNVSGIAKGTIINGGVESVSNGGMADGVTFAGSHSTLALATPSGLTGFIRNWHVGDIIDFQNTIVTGVNATSNTLTVTYGDHQTASYSLAGQQANTEFKLQSDGNGGTELVLSASSLGAPPFSHETAATIVYTAEFGIAPSTTQLSGLTQFTQAQFAYGQKIGVDAGIYAFTALGVALASDGQHFQNEFGSGNSAYPNSTAGDAKFVADAYGSVFGHAGSAAQVQHFVDQLNFYDGIYTAAGTFGDASNIDLLARGAVYGQMLGVDHGIDLGTPTGGTTYTAPPNQNNLVLNNGDVLNVNNSGDAFGTKVNNGATVNVNKGGSSRDATINDHGIENVNDGGSVIGANINSGGVQNVNLGALSRGSQISGGIENVSGQAVDTHINDGGTQHVLNGGIASAVQISPGGLQIVDSGGTARATVLRDSTAIISAGGLVEDVIFEEAGTLKLADPSQLGGEITFLSPGRSIIDFTHAVVTSVEYSAGVSLTVTYGDNKTAIYEVQIPAIDVDLLVPHLQSDGGDGTELVLTITTGKGISLVGVTPSVMDSVLV